MDVTINDAINAFGLLKEHVNENSFLAECYNLGISALKTIQDGNYILPFQNDNDISYEVLEKIASYDCGEEDCRFCPYRLPHSKHCASNLAAEILRYKELVEWYNIHKSEV